MDSFKLEANGVNALFIRSEVDLTEAVLQVTNLARVNFSTRWRQRRFHVQRIRTYNNHSSRDNPVFHFLATSCATAIAHSKHSRSYRIILLNITQAAIYSSFQRYDVITAVIQIAKLVLLGAFGTSFGVRGSRRGHQWYHSKKRCLFFHIGSPLWPLRYL